MGIYINTVPDSTEEKLKWLAENATKLDKLPLVIENKNQLPIVMIDNGAFIALAVANTQAELHYFMEHDDPIRDPRPKQYFIADIEAIRLVTKNLK